MKIFISYRRADSQFFVDVIQDYMIRHFGEGNVFLDVESIPFGVDFRVHLAEQIADHDVVLVIIGPNWARIMQEHADQENDFVRIEIENALKQNKLVIPVLVMNAEMPSFKDLPPSVADLQWRNSAIIRRKPDLEHDCIRLAEGIHEYFNTEAINASRQGTIALDELIFIGNVQRNKDDTHEIEYDHVESSDSITQSSYSSILDILPPPFEWIGIPAGKVTLEAGGYIPEGGQTFDLPAFQIAKYPITNAQYAKFVEAGGYKDKKWWTEAGWDACEKGYRWDYKSNTWNPSSKAWTEPRFWADEKWNGWDNPVVGVSWYEIIAFCNWLNPLVSNSVITLPTEQQWQRAAQGDDNRKYPWGNEFDKNRCNTNESGIKKTTPVAQYEGKGDSPFGVVGMAGNVWEWCLSDFVMGNQGYYAINSPVLRGGSFFGNQQRSYIDYRGNRLPYTRLSLFGFRIVNIK